MPRLPTLQEPGKGHRRLEFVVRQHPRPSRFLLRLQMHTAARRTFSQPTNEHTPVKPLVNNPMDDTTITHTTITTITTTTTTVRCRTTTPLPDHSLLPRSIPLLHAISGYSPFGMWIGCHPWHQQEDPLSQHLRLLLTPRTPSHPPSMTGLLVLRPDCPPSATNDQYQVNLMMEIRTTGHQLPIGMSQLLIYRVV